MVAEKTAPSLCATETPSHHFCSYECRDKFRVSESGGRVLSSRKNGMKTGRRIIEKLSFTW